MKIRITLIKFKLKKLCFVSMRKREKKNKNRKIENIQNN